MITFFTVQKENKGHIKVIQDNALKSWQLLGQEVLVLEDCKCNQYGTPLVDSIFETAYLRASNDIVCYVNADIILMSDFVRKATDVIEQNDKFLMVGQRWDLDVTEPIDFSNDWERVVRERVFLKGKLHGPTGIDFFLFVKGMLSDLPPFAIGRIAWDNWVLWRARNIGATVVDVTEYVMVVHQNHDYSHLKVDVNTVTSWTGPETDENLRLAEEHVGLI